MDRRCSQGPEAKVGLGAAERPRVPGPAGDPALPNNGQQVVAHVHFITFGVFLRIRLCKASSDFLERERVGRQLPKRVSSWLASKFFSFSTKAQAPDISKLSFREFLRCVTERACLGLTAILPGRFPSRSAQVTLSQRSTGAGNSSELGHTLCT